MAGMTDIRYIQFYPTVRCNLHCPYCFNKGLAPTDDVTIADFGMILSVLKPLGILNIDILGGEPTLHRGLIALLDIISHRDMHCTLSSNGTNVEILYRLSERYQRNNVKIGVSLHDNAVTQELHNYILRHRPVVKSLLTRESASSLCERYGDTPGMSYCLIYMDAVSSHDLANTLPFPHYYRELLSLKKIHQGLTGVFCSGFLAGEEDSLLKSIRCPAGTTKLSIAADGSVYPCYLLFPYGEFNIGNILRDDMHAMLRHPLLQYFRNFTQNRCPDTLCSLFQICHGGCPAMSYRFYGNLEAPDPRCLRDVRSKYACQIRQY
jgi:radical SAM protein with 4Fe4S-binding SPASM domain